MSCRRADLKTIYAIWALVTLNCWPAQCSDTSSSSSSSSSSHKQESVTKEAAPAFKQHILPPHLPTSQELAVDHFSELYGAYADGLRAAKRLAMRCNSKGLSGDIEMELSYLRIRHQKPKLVWEISPNWGYSTIYLLSALKDNEAGQLISFDTWDGPGQNDCVQQLTQGRHQMIVGDIKDTYAHQMDLHGLPDYLFLDSYHSYGFGMWYIQTLFPLFQGKHLYISLHDVYNPGFWSDEHFERDLKVYPEWMPNEEGMVIVDWIVYNDHACHVFTAAKSRWPDTYKHLVAMRNSIMGDDVERDYVLPYDANPTLFFELNCQSILDER